jgi:hypothetical protein
VSDHVKGLSQARLVRAEKVIDSRFVVAQLLAASGEPDAAAAELSALRPLLARAFGEDSTQVRNLEKQVGRLRTASQ